jgi:3-dehydroquinate dehydratase
VQINKAKTKAIFWNISSLSIEVIEIWLSMEIKRMDHHIKCSSDVCNILSGQVNRFGWQQETLAATCLIQQRNVSL